MCVDHLGKLAQATYCDLLPRRILAEPREQTDKNRKPSQLGDAPSGLDVRIVGVEASAYRHSPRREPPGVAGSAQADPCPWCGTRGQLLWIRSHVQCGACGQVVESCCEGPAGCA